MSAGKCTGVRSAAQNASEKSRRKFRVIFTIRQKACQHFISSCKNYSRKASHSKDADYVPLTYDIRRAKQKDLILKAIKNSAHSFDEILAFINSPGNDEEEADA